jgi:hypothetical protein
MHQGYCEVERLKIRDLDPTTRELFSGQWQALQSRFVDDPKRAIIVADALVSTVMQARSYPVADFNQRAADVSVDHPEWWQITGLRTRLRCDSTPSCFFRQS